MSALLRLTVAFCLVLLPAVGFTRAAPSYGAAYAAASPTPLLRLFPTESQAQAHCPRDTVVWLNTRTGIYHLKGERWYGNTKQGAYVCKGEADATPGDQETRNGQ